VGDGQCRNGIAGSGNSYDSVRLGGSGVAAEDCAKKCSACPGGGQTVNNVKLVLRGFELFTVTGRCYCVVDDGADLTTSVCQDATEAFDDNAGSGEIESSNGGEGGGGMLEDQFKDLQITQEWLEGWEKGLNRNNDIIPTRILGPNNKKEVRSRRRCGRKSDFSPLTVSRSCHVDETAAAVW
jgi:hypothetical protein